jgi:hypothetical protein
LNVPPPVIDRLEAMPTLVGKSTSKSRTIPVTNPATPGITAVATVSNACHDIEESLRTGGTLASVNDRVRMTSRAKVSIALAFMN